MPHTAVVSRRQAGTHSQGHQCDAGDRRQFRGYSGEEGCTTSGTGFATVRVIVPQKSAKKPAKKAKAKEDEETPAQAKLELAIIPFLQQLADYRTPWSGSAC